MLESNKEKKKEIITKFQIKAKYTGSSELQIALLTNRINILTEHFKTNKNDNHSKTGILKLISKRKNLLSYLKKKNLKKYKEIITNLNLRK